MNRSNARLSSRAPFYTRGFTLQELCITLAIGGVVMAGGAGLKAAITDTSKTAAVNDLVAHLNLARSEAITRRARITLCPSRDGRTCTGPDGRATHWHHGWLVYNDSNSNERPDAAEILRVHGAVGGGVSIRTSANRRRLNYQPLGNSPGSTFTFAFCDERGPQHARYVTVQNSGRARVSRNTQSTMRC